MVEPKATGTEAHKAKMPLHFTHFSLSAFRQGLFSFPALRPGKIHRQSCRKSVRYLHVANVLFIEAMHMRVENNDGRFAKP